MKRVSLSFGEVCDVFVCGTAPADKCYDHSFLSVITVYSLTYCLDVRYLVLVSQVS